MNRIKPRPSPIKSPAATAPTRIVEAARVRNMQGRAPYAIFAPLHYEPNYAYPLIVWLHGPGDSETQLKRVMPLVSLRNYVAIAPRGTAAAIPEEADQPRAYGWRQTDEQIQSADERVLECVEVAREKFNLAPGRCFLAGYDCGGTMAFRVALRNPQRFAGVLSFGGPFPTGRAPLAQLHAVRRLSVFIACARESRRYPSESVCDDLRLLHTAGMSIVLREYPGEESLAPAMLTDMDRWLMEQITSGSAAPAAAPAPR